MLTKLVRIGRDAELRFTPANKPVINLACVYDIGWGENKKSQWIDVTIWGKQAESLAQYLLKGKQIVIYADDIELEEYQKNDGSKGSKLKCRAINIDLTSGGQQQAQQPKQAPQQYQQQQAPQQNYQQQTQQPAQGNDFDNSFGDDIPF